MIKVLCVGKLKESYFADAAAEYLKRLSRFCRVEVIEIEESPIHDDNFVPALKAEGAKILAKLSGYVIALDSRGEQPDSVQFANTIEKVLNQGKDISFVIGSSHGLCDEVKNRADMALSFGRITLPHQLARVVLLEQIYRAFTIKHNITYHK